MTDPKKTLNIAGTGTRSIHDQPEVMELLVEKLVGIFDNLKKPYNLTVIAGGAKGFDYAFALAAMKAGVRLEIFLPSPTYLDYYWGEGKDRKKMEKVLAYADEHKTVCDHHEYGKANFTRNEAMVDACDVVFAFPNPKNPTKGGTAHCVAYAEQQQKKVRDMSKVEEEMEKKMKNIACDGKNGLCRHSQGGQYQTIVDGVTYHLCGVHRKMVDDGRDPGLKKLGRVAQAYLDKDNSVPEPNKENHMTNMTVSEAEANLAAWQAEIDDLVTSDTELTPEQEEDLTNLVESSAEVRMYLDAGVYEEDKEKKVKSKVKNNKGKKGKKVKKNKDKKKTEHVARCIVLWGFNMSPVNNLEKRFKNFFSKKEITHLYVPMGRDRNGNKIPAYSAAINTARSMGIKVMLIEISGQNPYKKLVKEAKNSDIIFFEKGKAMTFTEFAKTPAHHCVSFEFNLSKVTNVKNKTFVSKEQA